MWASMTDSPYLKMPRLFLASDDLLLVDCVGSAIVSVKTSSLGEETGLT